MPQSTHVLTVSQSLYDDVCDATEQTFADTYLFGARLSGATLTPRTVTGYHKMRDRRDFMDLLRQLQITLEKPTPWPGEGDRLSHKDAFR